MLSFDIHGTGWRRHQKGLPGGQADQPTIFDRFNSLLEWQKYLMRVIFGRRFYRLRYKIARRVVAGHFWLNAIRFGS